jgi:hypothetical protein
MASESGGNGGGGGGTSPIWDALSPPAIPNALDDEFSDSSVSASWLTWAPGAGGQIAASEDSAGMLVEIDTSIKGWTGLYKAVPAFDEFEILCSLSLGVPGVPPGIELAAGLFITEDITAAPDTAKIVTNAYLYDDGGPDGVQSTRIASFAANPTSAVKQATYDYPAGWLALQYKKSDNKFYAWHSPRGLTWAATQLGTDSLLGTAVHMGIGGVPVTLSGPGLHVRYQTFRVTRAAASGIVGTIPGPQGVRGT